MIKPYALSQVEDGRHFCPVCHGKSWSVEIGAYQVLDKWFSDLRRCDNCQTAWFADSDLWAKESYKDSIAALDTGCVRRAAQIVSKLSPYLVAKGRSKVLLDWGAGSGLTVRSLRDLGINAWAFEPYGECPLAKGFWYSKKEKVLNERFGIILAQEVVEHLRDIREFTEAALECCDDLIFTTEMIPDNVSRNWWYLLPETGQHISFIGRKGIKTLCRDFGLRHHRSHDGSMHLLTRKKRNIVLFSIMTHKSVAAIFMLVLNIYVYVVGKVAKAYPERDFEMIKSRSL